MKVKHQHEIEGEHNKDGLNTLINLHNYKFTEEHLEFICSFPGLCFDGSKIVKIDEENSIGSTIVHNFFSASDILFVISDESIMCAFEDIPKEKIGPYAILTFSHTETEIFVVGTGKDNENDIYIYSSITDESFLICNGIENFINNYLYVD